MIISSESFLLKRVARRYPLKKNGSARLLIRAEKD